MMAGFDRALHRRMGRILHQTAKAAARGFTDGQQAGATRALDDHRQKVEDLLRAHYQAVAAKFGPRVLEAFKGAPGSRETKDTEDLFSAALEEWIATQAAERAVRISETTRQQIIAAILAGEKEGLGIAGVAKFIEQRTGGTIASTRALTIARTETHMAANLAGETAAKATGLPLEKEWIANRNQERTRETHRIADRQRRKMDEAFQVGDAKLQRPGDPNGPAGEIINCRCVVGYRTKEA